MLNGTTTIEGAETVTSQPQKPSQLAMKGMLVSLTISRWQGRRKDNAVSDKVHSESNADANAGAYHKKLFPWNPEEWAALSKSASQLLQRHYKLTLPWFDNGLRLLPRDVYHDYMAEMRELRMEYDSAVVRFIRAYPTLMQQGRKHLGSLFKEADYPSQGELSGRFAAHIGQMPLPTESDFRIDIDAEALEVAAESYRDMLKEAEERANRDLWERLIDCVQAVLKSVEKYSEQIEQREASDDDESRMPALKESTMQRLRQMLELLPRLNIGDDDDLKRVRDEVAKRLAPASIDAMRDDAEKRAKFSKDADAIVRKMQAFMGGSDGEE
jgi:hypothetical protein